jgi:hypothetical protein
MRPDPAAAEVTCHSGHAYAERPVRFKYGGSEYHVSRIVHQTRSPEGRQFLVRTTSGPRFTITYLEPQDQWQVSSHDELLPPTQGEQHTRYDE